MLKNNIKTAWRILIKNKFVSLLNIWGLAIAMAASLFILEYVGFELSYDHFNKNIGDLYRVYNDRYQKGKLIQHSTMTYSAVSKAMKADFPEIVDYTRVEPGGKGILFFNDKMFANQRELAVEGPFLTMFSYPLIAGDPKTALIEPHSIVISKSLAEKMFTIHDDNFQSVLGQTIAWGVHSNLFKITGICNDTPENSHLQFDCLISYISLYAGKDSWKDADYSFTTSQFWHYVMLKPGTDYQAFEKKLHDFSQRHFRGTRITGSVEQFYLQPVQSAHLYSDFEYDIANTSNPVTIWGLFVIAVVILIIAWSNYVNLTTAKSIERAKEIGVRKVVGATKQHLIGQFMTESIIINLFSIIIASIIVIILQRGFNNLIGHKLSLIYLFYKSIGGYSFSLLLIAFILTGLFISGFYPSLILSSFKPALVLKARFASPLKGITLRKVLVVFQFTITISLIISSFVIYQQMRYVSRKSLGFNMSQMLVVGGPTLAIWDSTLLHKQNVFMNEIKKIPGVSDAAFSSNLPGEELVRDLDIRRNNDLNAPHFPIYVSWTSPNFIALYKIKLLSGRAFSNADFSPNGIVGRHNLILNLNAIKLLEFKSAEDAIGQKIIWNNSPYTIVGVVTDFHQRSMHYPIEPVMFMSGTAPNMPFSVKVDVHHLDKTIGSIKEKYNLIFPGNIYNYFFLDDKFNQQYDGDWLFGRAFAVFSGLAIFIASLGLLGLSFFAAFQRGKEIGIRKVLGASVRSILILLGKDFFTLVLVAIAIASPIAWFIMHYWLQNFASHITMSWWIFICSGAIVVIIGFLTICFQSMSVATANPVKSLRSE